MIDNIMRLGQAQSSPQKAEEGEYICVDEAASKKTTTIDDCIGSAEGMLYRGLAINGFLRLKIRRIQVIHAVT